MTRPTQSVLVDTSVFIDFFRGLDSPAVERLVELISADQVALCGLVEAEIRYGLRASEREKVLSLLGGFQRLDTEEADYRKAGDMGNELRSKGWTIPLHDCLIAALTARFQIPLLTTDEHFRKFETVKLLT